VLPDERSQVSLLLILLSILSLSAMVHYARLSLGRMSRMPDEESRSDLFNYRLMTVISLLVLTVSVVAIIAYNKSFYQ
jgi:heme/copper-type cytochrome/quinol oxidase subunit 2